MAKRMVKRARRATGMAVGAAVMYFCDPQLGARRRREIQDRVTSWWQSLGQGRSATSGSSASGVPSTGTAAGLASPGRSTSGISAPSRTDSDVQPVPPLERVPTAS